jgi:predicted DNA-binding protein (UPF0251 family)
MEMARPPIEKRVCRTPEYSVFTPDGVQSGKESVVLSVDEFEAIRLIDLEGVSREECAERMSIARTTAQAIYNNARVKIAEAMVNGLELRIEGGNFRICDGSAGCPKCCRRGESGQDKYL